MPESSVTAFRFVEHLHRFPRHLFVARHHHLSNALTIVDHKRFITQIHQNHAQFTAVVRIHRPRRVQYRDTVFQSQTRTRTHLRFITLRQCNEKTRRHQCALQWSQCEGRLEVSTEIQTCTLRSGIFWQRMLRTIHDFYLHKPKKRHYLSSFLV